MRRFLWVVLPLLLGYAAIALQGLCRWNGFPRLKPAALATFIGALALVPPPGTVPVWREIVASPAGEARTLAQSPARCLSRGLRGAAQRRAAFLPVIDLLKRARRHLPPDVCIASAIPERTMFYARRRNLDLVRGIDEPRTLLAGCPYVLAVAFRSSPDNGVPPMFPYRLLRRELTVLDVAPINRQHREAGIRAVLACSEAVLAC